MESKKIMRIQKINNTYCLMMSLMKCYDSVVTSVDLIIRMIWNNQQTSIILKICVQWMEQKNGGNAHRNHSVGTLNITHPLLLLLLMLSFLCCFCRCCWNKNSTLDFYHRYNAQTCTVLKHIYYKIMINKENYTETRYKYL